MIEMNQPALLLHLSLSCSSSYRNNTPTDNTTNNNSSTDNTTTNRYVLSKIIYSIVLASLLGLKK